MSRNWHSQIEENYERLLTEELGEEECGAFLVWGDPTLYDSTLRIIEKIKSKGSFALEYEVIPGISSVQALAARAPDCAQSDRQNPFISRPAGSWQKDFPTTPTAWSSCWTASSPSRRSISADIDIYWGAYIGTEDEILVSGRLSEVVNDIEAIRAEARREKGWIMDAYLLRKTGEK